jgi:hypothetical protein
MFHLRSTPFPKVTTATAGKLERWAKELSRPKLPEDRRTLLRAQIDAAVAHEMDLTLTDLQQIMADFPLLDRGEPALQGESKSTVTRDLFFATFLLAHHDSEARLWSDRVRAATEAGAQAYRPSFLVED